MQKERRVSVKAVSLEELLKKKIKWKKARKKPVVVEFREVVGEKEAIKTREGTLYGYKGKDFIIKGIKGEIYPIGKDIFYKTYEVLDDSKLEGCFSCGR